MKFPIVIVNVCSLFLWVRPFQDMKSKIKIEGFKEFSLGLIILLRLICLENTKNVTFCPYRIQLEYTRMILTTFGCILGTETTRT